jgi:hypothetical protein
MRRVHAQGVILTLHWRLAASGTRRVLEELSGVCVIVIVGQYTIRLTPQLSRRLDFAPEVNYGSSGIFSDYARESPTRATGEAVTNPASTSRLARPGSCPTLVLIAALGPDH